MELLKALAYVIALIIVAAVGYTIASNFTLPEREGPQPAQPGVFGYTPPRTECPVRNASRTTVLPVDVLRAVGGIDLSLLLHPNLSGLNVTKYLIEYGKLALLTSVPLQREGSAYELHPLPVSDGDREELLNRTAYVCTPPGAFHPPLRAVNLSSMEGLFVRNASTLVEAPAAGLGNYSTWVVTATPPPYAVLANLSVSGEALATTLVEGYAEVLNSSLEEVGSEAYGGCWDSGDLTYCWEVVIHDYMASWGYVAGYAVNGTPAYSRVVAGSAGLSGGGSGAEVVSSSSDGYYMGFGPLAEVEVVAHHYTVRGGGCRTEGNRTYCYSRTDHGVSGLDVVTRSRGLRIDTLVNATLSFVALPATGVEPVGVLVQESAVLRPGDSVRLPVGFTDSFDFCTYLEGGGFKVLKCLSEVLGYTPRRTSSAGYVTLSYRVLDFEWGWGTVVDVTYELKASGGLYEPPHAPALNLTEVFYRFVEDSVLRYVSSTLHTYASGVAGNYTEFQFWSLATQIPAEMSVCKEHNQSLTPLLNALTEGCGSNSERALILSRILNYSGLGSTVKEVTARMPEGLEIINVSAEAVFTVINSYPEPYSLTGVGYATRVEGGYLIAYDTAQNNVFSDLRKLRDPP